MVGLYRIHATGGPEVLHWEDEVLRTGSSPLHLSIKSRVRQLGEIKSVLRKLLA